MGLKMNRRHLLAGFAAAGAAALLPIEAFAASWVTLGTKTVNLLADHDRINVGVGAGSFKKLRIKVTGNTVFIHSMTVTFGNGATHQVPLRFAFLPGTWSRVIDLPGAARQIKRVDFVYSRRRPVARSVRLSVMGRGSGCRSPTSSRTSRAGWRMRC
jgi:hypothetical protein